MRIRNRLVNERAEVWNWGQVTYTGGNSDIGKYVWTACAVQESNGVTEGGIVEVEVIGIFTAATSLTAPRRSGPHDHVRAFSSVT